MDPVFIMAVAVVCQVKPHTMLSSISIIWTSKLSFLFLLWLYPEGDSTLSFHVHIPSTVHFLAWCLFRAFFFPHTEHRWQKTCSCFRKGHLLTVVFWSMWALTGKIYREKNSLQPEAGTIWQMGVQICTFYFVFHKSMPSWKGSYNSPLDVSLPHYTVGIT